MKWIKDQYRPIHYRVLPGIARGHQTILKAFYRLDPVNDEEYKTLVTLQLIDVQYVTEDVCRVSVAEKYRSVQNIKIKFDHNTTDNVQ